MTSVLAVEPKGKLRTVLIDLATLVSAHKAVAHHLMSRIAKPDNITATSRSELLAGPAAGVAHLVDDHLPALHFIDHTVR